MNNKPYPDAKNLKELARWAGLTYKEIGERTGLSSQTVSKIASGKQRLYVDQLIELARVIGVSLPVVLNALHYDLSGVPDSDNPALPSDDHNPPSDDPELQAAVHALLSCLRNRVSPINE